MFNPLTADRLAGVLGRVLRDSERWSRPLEPFQSGQLKSASSIARFLSAELAHEGPVLRDFRARVGVTLRRHGLEDRQRDIEQAEDVEILGERLCVLLDEVRRAGLTELGAELHTLIRELTDTEIDILAGAGGQSDIGRGGKG